MALLPMGIPTPSPSTLQEEIVHPIVEECTEEPGHTDSAPCLVDEQEVEDESVTAGVPVPPSTPLIGRRSGGPRDRIALPHERQMYYGPRPPSTQWQAYLRAGSPMVDPSTVIRNEQVLVVPIAFPSPAFGASFMFLCTSHFSLPLRSSCSLPNC